MILFVHFNLRFVALNRWFVALRARGEAVFGSIDCSSSDSLNNTDKFLSNVCKQKETKTKRHSTPNHVYMGLW